MNNIERLRRYAVPAASLAVGVLLSIGLYLATDKAIERGARSHFEEQTSNIQLAIKARLNDYSDVLYGIGALFRTTNSLSRAQFHQYVSALNLQNYPGIQNLNYSQLVPAPDRARFEAAVRGDRSVDPDGYPAFAIHPPSSNPVHNVMTYMEPLRGYESAFGLDLLAVDPQVTQALIDARDSGKITASGRLINVGKGKPRGLAMRLPLYRNGMPLNTAGERRAAYVGTVGAGFDIEKVFFGVVNVDVLRQIRFKLYDTGSVAQRLQGAAPAEHLLYDSGPSSPAPAEGEKIFTATSSWEVGGRMWESRFTASKANMLNELDAALPWLALFAGLLTTSLSFSVLNSLSLSRARAEHQLQYVVGHDTLTELPNRSMFHQALRQALARDVRQENGVAVLFVDIDRFKVVNDMGGPSAGDRVLRESALRIRDCLRDSDIVARLGGDEFAIVVEQFDQSGNLAMIAKKILASIEKPFLIEDREFLLAASIGISIYPDDGEDPDTLLKNADVAMYRAKVEGNSYQYYSAQMNALNLARFAMESSLRHAIERNEFLLHYQPKLDLRTNRVTGFEALVRWQHPELGLVPPARFIPLAEETGMIIEIGQWVLRMACRQACEWRRHGQPGLRVAVNLSTRQFNHKSLLKDIKSTLAETGLDPGLLELEITESMVMHNIDHAIRLLRELKAMGIHLSIDDFGTGYSSLAYLRKLPVDCVKIDRAFIKDVPIEVDDMVVSKSIIMLGHSLRLRVVAEGVETQEQLDFLREQGCDEIQGYLFSKPLPAEEIGEFFGKKCLV